MSAEIVRYALDKTRCFVESNIKEIMCNDARPETLLFLVEDGGRVGLNLWSRRSRPCISLRSLVQRFRAVAALVVTEFDRTDAGYHAACAYWCYPYDGLVDSCFFVMDPENLDVARDYARATGAPEILLEWLEITLVETLVA